MILNIFDFDDTLFRIPTYSASPFDFKADNVNKWYDHPESLNDEKYKIQLIENIATLARQSEKDRNCISILITRRIPELRDHIIRILKKHEINFDSHYIIGHNTLKSEILTEILTSQYGDRNITEINIFEDCLYQILDYQNALDLFFDIKSSFTFVDKSHVIAINKIEADVIGKIKLSY